MAKKIWYKVTSGYYEDGRITAGITETMETEYEPATTWSSSKRCDVYHDWFDSLEEANEFIQRCRKE